MAATDAAVRAVRRPHAAQLRAQPHPIRAHAPAPPPLAHQPLPQHRALLQAGKATLCFTV